VLNVRGRENKGVAVGWADWVVRMPGPCRSSILHVEASFRRTGVKVSSLDTRDLLCHGVDPQRTRASAGVLGFRSALKLHSDSTRFLLVPDAVRRSVSGGVRAFTYLLNRSIGVEPLIVCSDQVARYPWLYVD